MVRVLRELVVLVVVLLVAGGLIVGYAQVASTPSRYDTFSAKVNKLPLQISSPVYGQLLTLPLAEGSQVGLGQVIATVQVLDRNFKLPSGSQLFKLQGDTLSVVSPAAGVVAKIDVAPLSTVGGGQRLVELYTLDSTDLWVLLPQGTDVATYRAFFVWPRANKPTYRIQIEGSIPTDVVGGTSPRPMSTAPGVRFWPAAQTCSSTSRSRSVPRSQFRVQALSPCRAFRGCRSAHANRRAEPAAEIEERAKTPLRSKQAAGAGGFAGGSSRPRGRRRDNR